MLRRRKLLNRGGERKGAGRPFSNGTIRRTVSWRLPIHLLTRVHNRAELEGLSVTAWVERAISEALKSNELDRAGTHQA
jgi:hypothetical protein